MPGLTRSLKDVQALFECVSVWMCVSACMCVLHGSLIYRAWRWGVALPQKGIYWVSSISISFGPSLSERGMNTGANHTGLHSITISLCCHGSQALSRVKISHCTKRGLMSEHTYEHVCTHIHTCSHWRGKWPVHLVLILSHTFTLLLWQPPLCMAQQLHAHVHWAPTITGASMCESVQVSDSIGLRDSQLDKFVVPISPFPPVIYSLLIERTGKLPVFSHNQSLAHISTPAGCSAHTFLLWRF